MNSTRATEGQESSRVAIINAVKTPLSFFVLVVIIVEIGLGGLAAKVEAQNQMTIVYLMVVVILTLVAAVVALTYKRPWDLVAPANLKRLAETHEGLSEVNEFCKRIAGHWWEQIEPDDSSALSFVEISSSPATGTVRMCGRAYSRTGTSAAVWETVASCVNPQERKVFYSWKGEHPARPREPYEGFGEMSFHESLDTGDGVFLDTNLVDWASTRKSVKLARATEKELQVMRKGTSSAVGDLVQEKLRSAA